VDDVFPDAVREPEGSFNSFLLCLVGIGGRERSEVATLTYSQVTLNDAQANSTVVASSERRTPWEDPVS